MLYVSLLILSVLSDAAAPPGRHILKVAGRLEESESILDNNPAAGMAQAMAKAWELYASPR